MIVKAGLILYSDLTYGLAHSCLFRLRVPGVFTAPVGRVSRKKKGKQMKGGTFWSLPTLHIYYILNFKFFQISRVKGSQVAASVFTHTENTITLLFKELLISYQSHGADKWSTSPVLPSPCIYIIP